MDVEIDAERRRQLLRPQDFQRRMRFGQETARRPREAAEGTDTMIDGVFGSKPNEILLSFRDRIEAQNAIITMAWPSHVHIQALAKPA